MTDANAGIGKHVKEIAALYRAIGRYLSAAEFPVSQDSAELLEKLKEGLFGQLRRRASMAPGTEERLIRGEPLTPEQLAVIDPCGDLSPQELDALPLEVFDVINERLGVGS